MSDLKHLLKTNRELLRVLDEQLGELERVAPEYADTFSEKQAYIYLSTYTQGDTEARIQIDQDATYVAEKLFIIEESEADELVLSSVGQTGSGDPPALPASRTFSLVDENSGREMTISAVGKQPVSSGAVPTFAIPFVTNAVSFVQALGSYTPYTGQTEWWFQFRDEFVLPRGAVLRIRSTTLDGEVKPQDFRFSVALVGYKVFG
jgi:hypothetical protein